MMRTTTPTPTARPTTRTRLLTAAAAALLAAGPAARAAVTNWTSATPGTTVSTTANQLWLNPANWDLTVPGAGDVASFNTVVPATNTVDLDFADAAGGAISAGAIAHTYAGKSLTVTGLTAGTLTLNGATVTVPFPVGGTETFANTILASTDATATNKNFTLGGNVNLALTGSTNNILGFFGAGAGNASNPPNGNPLITVAGNISDATPSVHAGVTYLGGGTGSNDGGVLELAGTNTFSGGLTIGNTAGTQGGSLVVLAPGNLPATGPLTVNEQGQIYIPAASPVAAPYSNAGQTLVLNGIGVNKNISGTLRSGGGTFASPGVAANPLVWAGNIQLGTAAAADATNGFVILSITGTGQFDLTGNLTGTGPGGTGGSFQKQGGGTLEFGGTANTFSGGTLVGNGGLIVDAGSSLGTGDLNLFQTSTNTPIVTFNNVAQTVANLSSNFTALVTTGFKSGAITSANGFTQNVNLVGNGATPTALTVTSPTANTSFGYGAVAGLTTGISGAGSLTVNSTAGHTLTLTGFNTYAGGTTIAAGVLSAANLIAGTSASPGNSATGPGPVVVNRGGTLAGGTSYVPAGTLGLSANAGYVAGPVTVNAGGTLAAGGTGLGSITVGSLQANAGSSFTFNIAGPSAGNFSTLASQGAITLDPSGAETVNVIGSRLASGTFNLVSAPSIAGNTFTLGATPAGPNRTYALSTTSTAVVLTVVNTGTERDWSVTGTAPPADGPGTWQQGSTTFVQLTPTSTINNAPYNNADNSDAAFGNGGNGGPITIGAGGVRVGGLFILGQVQTPYTFGAAGSTNAITTVGGIAASNSTLVNAPLVLGGSQSITTDAGVTLNLAGGVGQSTASTLTKVGGGTLVLGGTGTYAGGTVVSAGTLQTTTAALPTAGDVADAAVLDFDQPAAGTYAGLISGAGSVNVNASFATTANAGAVTLSNTSNSYTGQTVVTAGALVVPAVGVLGSGAGGIQLAGGTLRAAADLAFPLNGGAGTPARSVVLAANTTSTVDTAGHAVTFGQNIAGSGNLNVSGGGSLTLTGVPSTTVLGNVGVTAGSTFVIAPPANIPSFGFSADNTGTAFAGNLTVQTPIELRLFGGSFSGGGTITVVPNNVQIVSRGTTIIGDTIALNPAGAANFTSNLGAQVANSLAINGPITGLASVDFTGGAGTITLGGVSTYTGSTTVDNGTGGSVTLAVNNALPVATALNVTSSGVFDLNGFNQTVASLNTGSTAATVRNNNNNTTGANSVLTVNGSASTTYQGLLSDQTFGGTLGLTINGTGSLALPTPELYSGPTTLLGGRLDVVGISPDDSSTGLGSTSAITIGGGPDPLDAQLRLNGVVGTVSFVTGNHPSATAPVITLNSVGGYPVAGDAGAIRVINQSNVTLPDAVVFAATSSIAVANGSTATLAGTLSGPGTLVSVGNGLLFLTGNNAGYAGGTEVDAGTLTVAAGSALGTGPLAVNSNMNAAGGSAVTLSLSNSAQTVGSLSGSVVAPATGTNSAAIVLNGTALTVTQTTAAAYAGTIAGTGSLTKTGPATLTLAGVTSFTGPTTVSAGTLAVAATGSLSANGTTTVATGAALTFLANTPGGGIVAQTTGPLVVNGAAAALSAAAPGDRTLVSTPSLSVAGSFDLGANDLAVRGGSLAAVNALVASGYANGRFNGPGLTTSAALANAARTTTLGVIQDTTTGSPTGPVLRSSFDGQPAAAADVLVKYTYYGDANLDGVVNGADYVRVDAGYAAATTASPLTGWYNGDFNYDGHVDGSDYTLIDNAFNLQSPAAVGPSVAATPLLAAATAEIAPAPSAVPEPATLGLLATAAAGLLARRRRA